MKILLLLFLAHEGLSTNCNCGSGTVHVGADMRGWVATPGYPESYKCGKIACDWVLEGGSPIEVEFPNFDTNPGYDYLQVYDGSHPYTNSLLETCSGAFCNRRQCRSDHSSFLLRWHQDDPATGSFRGFNATFRVTSIPQPTTPPPTCHCRSFFGHCLCMPGENVAYCCGGHSSAPITPTPAPGPDNSQCFTCYDYWLGGARTNGVYDLLLKDPVQGLVRQIDGSVSFHQSYGHYIMGFGNLIPNGSFWWGLENMHKLTSNCGAHVGRFEMGTCNGSTAHEDYSLFNKFIFEGKSPACPDGSSFSAYDAQHDGNVGLGCSNVEGGGGWWFNDCANGKFNGIYRSGCQDAGDQDGNFWYNWPGPGISTQLSSTAIKTRPANAITTPGPSTTPAPYHPTGQCTLCYDLFKQGHRKDGVYPLSVSDGNGRVQSVQAVCDMTGGGYTMLQQRVDGSVSFARGLSDYISGFGDKATNGNFWLGLETMHWMTSFCGPQKVRFDLLDGPGTQYTLHVSLGTGLAGLGLCPYGTYGTCPDGKPFSTFDNDANSYGCVGRAGKGGWWYDGCNYSQLNGQYYTGCQEVMGNKSGIWWYGFPGPYWGSYLSRAGFKIRPLSAH